MKDLMIVISVWNVIVFAVFGIDKYKAKYDRWRISEATLILLCFLMGGAGGIAGMYIFRHKTKHIKFKILVPAAIACNILTLLGMYKYIL